MICQFWETTRSPIVADLIRTKGYIASQPLTVRVRTALLVHQDEWLLAGDAVTIKELVTVLQDSDQMLRSRAHDVLGRLTQQKSIGAFCALWEKSRSNELQEILETGQYIPSNPVSLQVICALKQNRLDIIATRGSDAIVSVVKALDDTDRQIVDAAVKYLTALTDQQSIDAICKAWNATPSLRLTTIIQKASYIPSQPDGLKIKVILRFDHTVQLEVADKPLIEHLVRVCDSDEELQIAAAKAIISVANPYIVDTLCRQWEKTRSKKLESIIRKQNMVASESLSTRILTALLTGNTSLTDLQTTDAIDCLLTAYSDDNQSIRDSATSVLMSLTDPRQKDIVCSSFITGGNESAREIALLAGYVPSEADSRILFYYMTEQWQKYEELDDDGSQILL